MQLIILLLFLYVKYIEHTAKQNAKVNSKLQNEDNRVSEKHGETASNKHVIIFVILLLMLNKSTINIDDIAKAKYAITLLKCIEATPNLRTST